MLGNKDTLSLVEKTWRFDNKVAIKFDTHVNQSIPHYLDLQSYTVKLSEWFLKDNTLVYDLGCSTGETIKAILNLNISTKFSIMGFDNSQKMIELAKRKTSKIIKNNERVKVNFQCKDITKINLKKSNLIISFLLFPFLNSEQRRALLKKIYKSLNSGGAFICVEKIRAKNSYFEDILNQMYFDFKLSKNLSEEEILNKAKSLRSSMYLFDEKKSKSLLESAGFKNYEIFFKCFNFIGYIAIR